MKNKKPINDTKDSKNKFTARSSSLVNDKELLMLILNKTTIKKRVIK